MPVSVVTARDPFRGVTALSTADATLRVPQARVLAALLPSYPEDPPCEWPLLTRVALASRIGVSQISDSIHRAMNGIPNGSSSDRYYLGLIALNLVEKLAIDIDGKEETNFRITLAGIHAYQQYVALKGQLRPIKGKKG